MINKLEYRVDNFIFIYLTYYWGLKGIIYITTTFYFKLRLISLCGVFFIYAICARMHELRKTQQTADKNLFHKTRVSIIPSKILETRNSAPRTSAEIWNSVNGFTLEFRDKLRRKSVTNCDGIPWKIPTEFR